MTFVCDIWLELGIGIRDWDWELEWGLGLGNWIGDWRLGLEFRNLEWGLE